MKTMKQLGKTFLATVVGALLLAQPMTSAAQAQDAAPSLHLEGLTHQPSEAASKALLDPNDAVVLLVDHQTGLFQTVNDVPVADLRRNTVALAEIAKQANMPIIYTASEPDGPNGPLMKEFEDVLPESATYVARKGEVSAWDNADFVKAVEATGRKTLIIAGVWTSVCVAFPALEATADGYNVYVVMDASGDVSKMASDVAMQRMVAEGITPVTTNTILSESHRTWNRPDWQEWGNIYADLVPEYGTGVESYMRAQQAATKSE